MGGLFSRVKNWIGSENLYTTDLNAEFNNVINNFEPSKMDDYSASVSQMQIQTNPGNQGSESQPTSLAGEIERIRYKISQLIGKTFWYDAPTRSLEAGYPELAFYLPIDGSSATRCLQDVVRRGALINAVSYSSADVNSNDFNSSNAKFGNFAFGLGAGNFLAFPGNYNSPDEGSLSLWVKGASAGDYLAFNPLLGVEVFLNGAGQVVNRIRKRTAATNNTKAYSTVTGTTTISGSSNYSHVLAKWAINGVAGTAADKLGLKLNGTAEGSQLANQTININHENGGTWFFGAKPNDPTWTNFSAMNVTPDSDGWTQSGTGTAAVSDGVLSIATSSTNKYKYSRSGATVTGLDLSSMTIEFKMRITSYGSGSSTGGDAEAVKITVRDDSMNRSFNIRISASAINLASTSSSVRSDIDAMNWNHIRVTSSGGVDPVTTLYINGVNIGSFTNTAPDATVNDLIEFGDDSTSAVGQSTTEWEWFAFGPSALPVVAADAAGGYLDDIAMYREYLNDSSFETSISTLVTKSVAQKDKIHGVTLPKGQYSIATGSRDFYFPSDGLTHLLVQSADMVLQSVTDGDYTVASIVIDDETAFGTTSEFALSPVPSHAINPVFSASARSTLVTAARSSLFKIGLVKATVLNFYTNSAGVFISQASSGHTKRFMVSKV